MNASHANAGDDCLLTMFLALTQSLFHTGHTATSTQVEWLTGIAGKPVMPPCAMPLVGGPTRADMGASRCPAEPPVPCSAAHTCHMRDNPVVWQKAEDLLAYKPPCTIRDV